MTSPRRSLAPWALPILTGIYFVAGKLGLRLAFVHASATGVWPPTGIALAALLLLGYRAWPAIFLGAFLVNLTTAGSVATSIGIATGNTLEGLLGALLVTRWASGPRVFDRPQDVFTFMGLVAPLSTAVSATLGVTSLCLGGFARWDGYGPIWLTWWLGDMAGDLVVAPLITVWATGESHPWTRRRLGEASLLAGCMLVTAWAVFGGLFGSSPVAFLCAPPLIWAAFRFGSRETVTAIALLSGFAILETLRGFGPFVRPSQNMSLLLLQAFLGTTTMMTLVVSAVVTAHRRAERALARVAAIVESSDDAIVTKTLDGVITSWNPAAERLYGYAAREVVGQSVSIVIPPELPNELPAILGQISRGERVDHYETVRRRRDGTRIEVSVTVSPVKDPEGRIVAASSITRDITERKAAEATRRESDLLRSVASLAATAAHEINNPLTVLMGHVQLSAVETSAPDHRRLEAMLTAISRIRGIVAEMRHVKRLEPVRQSPHLPEMLDLWKSTTDPGKGE